MNASQFPGQTLQPIPGISGGEDQYSVLQKINQLLYQIAQTSGSGVQSITAGTNITITGTSTNPIINASGSAPGGATTQIQFNDSGAFGGDANFTWNKTAGTLIIGGIANNTSLILSGGSVTGANTTALVSLTETWNTSGAPTALDVNITNTASAATSLLANFRTGATNAFSISPVISGTGAVRIGGTSARLLMSDGSINSGEINYEFGNGAGFGFVGAPNGLTVANNNGTSFFSIIPSAANTMGVQSQSAATPAFLRVYGDGSGASKYLSLSHNNTNPTITWVSGSLVMTALPTSAAGLPSGALYTSAGVVMQAP